MSEDGAASVVTGGRPGRRRPNPVSRMLGRRGFLLAVVLAAILVPPAPLALPRAGSVEARWIPVFAGMTVRSDNRIGVDGIIPAFAGMTEGGVPVRAVRTVIPARAGMKAGGASGCAMRTRVSTFPEVTASTLMKSFPRRRESIDSRALPGTSLSADHGRAQSASQSVGTDRAAFREPYDTGAGALARIGHRPGRGMFLLAAPQLRDPRFAQTVVLLLEYDETGALGLVINRPTEASLHDVLATPLPNSEGHAVFAGGPVELRRLIALLRSPDAVDGAERLFGDVHASGSMDTLRRMLERDGHAADVHAYLGYAGWAPGQLDAEIARGDWIVAPADAGSVFDTPPVDVWPNLMRRNAGRWVRAGPVRPA